MYDLRHQACLLYTSELSFLLASEEELPSTWWTSMPEPTPLITAWVGGPRVTALKQRVGVNAAPEALAFECVQTLAKILGQPAAWKGYTIGDNTHKEISRYPWRMDDPAVTYLGYEKFAKAGRPVVAVHKGLFPPSDEQRFPKLTQYAKVDDVGRAAKDWPQLKFLIYHAGYRYTGGDNPELAAKQFDETGRMDWVSDLAQVPAKYAVTNVYADVGASFAALCVSHPRAAAAMLGILIKGLGADHVLWGTDSLWFGSPQWQIEAFRRMEIPEDMQRQHGFAPLGPANGAIKCAILGENGPRVYGIERKVAERGWGNDGLARHRACLLYTSRCV